MATKPKYLRLESDIEKYRVEYNWEKAVEAARLLSNKTPGLEDLTKLLIGESKLEEYLKENPPSEKNILKARSQLSEAESYLSDAVRLNSKLKLQAELLLAKICYCKGSYSQVLMIYDRNNLQDVLVESQSHRFLYILAEAIAIKGLCLEKTIPESSSKYKADQREKAIIECYERAGDLAILHLQEREKFFQIHGTSSNVAYENLELGPILETAIQESPILHIRNGEVNNGISRFRELLRAVQCRFTEDLRLTLARELAEVLLRGMCEKSYSALETRELRSDGKPKPRKYSGDRLFIPEDETEEILLLLLIAESIANKEAVLNISTEHSEARMHSFHNTNAVYDLLAITLVKRAQFAILSECLERALKFSFAEFHIWYQFANSLICAGKNAMAKLCLAECARLQPDNPVVLLQAGRLCFEYLHQVDEGILFVEQALAVGDQHPMASRIYVALGIGYSLKAYEMKLKGDRQQWHKKSLNILYKAHKLDPTDYLALFHLALQLAILRQINEALNYVRQSLKYRNDYIHSLHLLVLLLSAQKQYDEAMVLMKAALEEYPDNLSLQLTKSKLEEILYGPDEALISCKNMLKLWKELHEINSEENSDSQRKGNTIDRTAFDKRSVVQLQLAELSERGSVNPFLLGSGGSCRAESIAASRMEHTLSDLASSLNSSFAGRPGSEQSWQIQAQIWLHLAELYLRLGKVTEAESCVHETSGLFPLSHQVYYMKGMVDKYKQKYYDAKYYFENAVSINPGHTKSLLHLGFVLHELGNNKMAEKILRDAVNADPTSHKSWHSLGVVLESLGQPEAASDCHMAAMDLEATSPVVPFTVIPKQMH